MRICSIEGCENKHDARGYCHKHYLRWKSHGDPNKVLMPIDYHKKTTEKCSVDSCENEYLAKGFCRLHYLRNKRKVESQICRINGCENTVIASGVCNTHYLRIKKNKPVELKSCYELTPKERLLKFVKIDDETNCWMWIGGKNKKGYGSLHFGGKTRIAHRMAYELYVGEIPKGLLVCHHCDRPACINFEHLFLGTDLDNSNDKFSKNRFKPLNGELNGMSKLSNEDVIKIKLLLKENKNCAEIGRMFNVTDVSISGIKNNKTWRHVNV